MVVLNATSVVSFCIAFARQTMWHGSRLHARFGIILCFSDTLRFHFERSHQ
jgi:hypothetical protein